MKKILVPTDFSKYANNALQMAGQIAKKIEAEISLLHVVPPPNPLLLLGSKLEIPEVEQQYIDRISQKAQANLKELLENHDFSGVTVNHELQLGNVFKSIQQYIKEQSIDLIVMGTKGANGLEEFFVGSNTEKIARMATCPLLSVHAKNVDFSPKKVVFATNFKQNQANAFLKVREFLAPYQPTFYLLQVNTPGNLLGQNELEKHSNDFLNYSKTQSEDFAFEENYVLKTHSAISIEKGILDFAQEVNADLLVLPTHQRKGLAHFFAGSTAEDIINHSERLVMTLGLH